MCSWSSWFVKKMVLFTPITTVMLIGSKETLFAMFSMPGGIITWTSLELAEADEAVEEEEAAAEEEDVVRSEVVERDAETTGEEVVDPEVPEADGEEEFVVEWLFVDACPGPPWENER